MKTWEDVQKRLKNELTHWFTRQCQNEWEDYYLYYCPVTPEHDGGLLIASQATNERYRLVLPERINKGKTIEQNYHYLIDHCRRLPILSP